MPMEHAEAISKFYDIKGNLIDERKDKVLEGSVFRSLERKENARWREVAEIKYFDGARLMRHVRFDYGGPVDVVEVYSPPRVASTANKFGLQAGESFDLATGWGFSKAADRREVEKYMVEHEPLLLIGSPLCTMFSSLQHLSPWTVQKQKRLEDGKMHLGP